MVLYSQKKVFLIDLYLNVPKLFLNVAVLFVVTNVKVYTFSVITLFSNKTYSRLR